MGPVALLLACGVDAAVWLCKPGLLGHGALARRARMLGGRACVAQAAWALLSPWLLAHRAHLTRWVVFPALCLCRFHRTHDLLLRLFALEILVYTKILETFWRVPRRACLLLLAVAGAGALAGRTGARDACICAALLILKLCCSAWRTGLTTQAALMQEMSSAADSTSRALYLFTEEMKTFARTKDARAKQRADKARASLRWRPAFFHSFAAYLSWTAQRFFRLNVAVPVPEEQQEMIAAELSICLTCRLCFGAVLALRMFGVFMLCYVLPVLCKVGVVLIGLACSVVLAAWTVVWRVPGALEDLLQVHRQYCDHEGWVLCGA